MFQAAKLSIRTCSVCISVVTSGMDTSENETSVALSDAGEVSQITIQHTTETNRSLKLSSHPATM